MALPPLTGREKILYKDTFTAYIPVNANSRNSALNMIAGNDIEGWTIALQPDGSKLQNIPCNLHLTPNFDLIRGPAGLVKELNIDTSNLLSCQRQAILIAAMRLYCTTRYGDSYWFKVQGAPEKETLVPCCCVYLVPDDAPDVIL